MKRRMEQLINGRYIYEVPRLHFSDEQINVRTKVDENYRGELYIGAEDGRRVKGMVMSEDRRLLLAKDKFAGKSACIPYGIDVKGLKPGDCVDTDLVVNSNIGEYTIPVHLEVEESHIGTSGGVIRTLNEFVKLAQKDFREAFRLYTNKNFKDILNGTDRKYMTWYMGMTRNPVTYQHMEEFLIAAGKKKPVELHLDKQSRELERIEATLKDSLYIYRSGWGYVNAEIEVCGNFLEVEKKIITSEDFIGSVCGLEYLVRKENLRNGKNFGRILVKSVYGTLTYEVTASGKTEYEINTRYQENRIFTSLCREYLQYRLNNLSEEEWFSNSAREFEELRNLGCYNRRHQLMESFIYYKTGEVIRALEILTPLSQIVFADTEAEEEAWFLALAAKCGLISKEQEAAAKERVAGLYQRNPGSFLILESLFLLDSQMERMDKRRLFMLKELFDVGCRSPFLYLEVYEIMKKDAGNSQRLDSFTIQVMHFAARYQILTKELAFRICHLTDSVKNFQKSIYQLLKYAYNTYPCKEMLESICKYIMKGNPRKSDWFTWYSRAVEENIRITRLYEYYIETMPEHYQEVLPQVIRMYFMYNNSLSDKKRASVYANVIRNREQDRTTFLNYRKAMEQFAEASWKAGRISEDYAVIYQECLSELKSREQAQQAMQIIFTQRIYCDDPNIRSVIVRHEELMEEEQYTVNDGVAYVKIYTPDARLMFEDGKRRRYAVTVHYNIRKLLDEKSYVRQCLRYGVEDAGFLLYVCGTVNNHQEVRIKNLTSYQRAVLHPAFTKEYRDRTCRKVLEYYAAHAGDDTLGSYLRDMDYMMFAAVDKVLLCEILIEKGLYDMAFSVIQEYGFEGIRTESLVKLASRMILRTEFVEQEELVYLALHVFREGKYDDIILTYLSDNYMGTVEGMSLLWERMKGFQLDTYTLEEEILLLAMFGRVHLENGWRILQSYISQKGKEQVILSFLCFEAYEYFLGEKKVDDYIFRYMELCFDRNVELERICRLALLKYYAERKDYTKLQDGIIRRTLEECNEVGLKFAFFKNLPAAYTKPLQLDDKIFVECRYPLDAKVTIHYCMISGKQEEGKYKSEPVRNMYQGIFVKDFLLFYGEALRYYLSVETEKESFETKKRTLRVDIAAEDGDSKYQLLNRILEGMKLSNGNQTEEAMEKYLLREKMTDSLFHLME